MSDFLWKFAYSFAGIMAFYIFHKVLVLIYEAWKSNSEIGYRHGKRKAMNDKEENVESEPWLKIINVVECSKLLDIADKQEQLGYIQTADVLRRIAKGSDVD